jgi:acetyl esterase/lipase
MRAGGALSQCYTVWKAVSKDRFVLAAGDSAGGNMAAGLAFRILEDDPNAKLPDAMLLLYPVTDLTDTDSFSCRRFASGYGLMAEGMKAYTRLYADEEQRKIPLFSPVFGDFSRFPPSLVITCQFDVLRDQGRALAVKIKEAGRPIRYRCLKGTIHGCANRRGLDNAREDLLNEVKAFVELLRS